MVQSLWAPWEPLEAVLRHVSSAVELVKAPGFRHIGHTVAICMAQPLPYSEEAPLPKHTPWERSVKVHADVPAVTGFHTLWGDTCKRMSTNRECVESSRSQNLRLFYLPRTFQAALQNIPKDETGQNGLNSQATPKAFWCFFFFFFLICITNAQLIY